MKQDRSERYTRLQQDVAMLEPGRDDLLALHRRLMSWQRARGNLEALSRETSRSYLRLLQALERLLHRMRDPHASDSDKRGLTRLRDELVEDLSRDLAQKRPAAGELSELDPGFMPPFELSEWKKFYEQLTYQVTREDELVHQRLTWMMQYEGFLFTAFGFALGAKLNDELEHLRIALMIVIPIVGLCGAYAVHRGVRSAHVTLQSLKRAYLASLEVYKRNHVRPFGRHTEQFVSSVFPWILMCGWLAILGAVVWRAVVRHL